MYHVGTARPNFLAQSTESFRHRNLKDSVFFRLFLVFFRPVSGMIQEKKAEKNPEKSGPLS